MNTLLLLELRQREIDRQHQEAEEWAAEQESLKRLKKHPHTKSSGNPETLQAETSCHGAAHPIVSLSIGTSC